MVAIAMAVEGEVADGGGGPDVVHGPHHRLATLQDAAYAAEGEHALIDPMQVDDVGLTELPQLSDVDACIGNVNVEQVLA